MEHTKRVNTVKWLDAQHLISGADDGNAVLWQLDKESAINHILLKGHTSGVNAVDGVLRSNGTWLLATAAADNCLKLWHLPADKQINCFQTVKLDGGFCLTLRLTLLPKTEQVLLAFSTDEETVALWAEQSAGSGDTTAGQFNCVHKLSGHEDWVRGLDFVCDGDDLLLASGSQDNFIRLWRIEPRGNEQPIQKNILDVLNDNDELRVEEKLLQLGGETWYAISLESVLYGHEGWVYGVHWHKNEKQGMHMLVFKSFLYIKSLLFQNCVCYPPP